MGAVARTRSIPKHDGVIGLKKKFDAEKDRNEENVQPDAVDLLLSKIRW